MLSTRANNVLNILVDQYIQTATPVASEDIARLSATKVSSATVRSAMSRLNDEGYISRPHVSAGGIPSDLGYRHHVESLRELPELPVAMRRQIGRRLRQLEPHVELWSQQCASILSHLTANFAIVTVPQASSARLRHIELVYVQEFLVLLIIVLQEARLLRRLLPMEEGVDPESLGQVAGKLNDCLVGLSTDEIESNQLELTPLEERVIRDSVKMMREAETGGPQELCQDGLRRLINQPEFSQGNRAKELVEMVEERVILDSVLSEAPSPNDVAVYIGAENHRVALRPFSIIICGYGIPSQVSGTVSVIGPTRMSYSNAISAVRYLSSVMSQQIQEIHGGHPTW